MEADEKACPRCAETIKKAALVCPHCRADLDERKREGTRIVVLTLAAIAIIVWFFSTTEMFQAAPIGPVAVATLEKEFDADRAAAVARYGNHPIIVDGEIASVHSDRVTLKTIYLLNVQAYFKGSTSSALVGPAQLRCDSVTFQDYFGTTKPLLNGCRLA